MKITLLFCLTKRNLLQKSAKRYKVAFVAGQINGFFDPILFTKNELFLVQDGCDFAPDVILFRREKNYHVEKLRRPRNEVGSKRGQIEK